METRPAQGPPPKASTVPNSVITQQQWKRNVVELKEAQEKLKEARELQSKAALDLVAMQADLLKAQDEKRAVQQRANAVESDATAKITALQTELRSAQRRAETAQHEAKAQGDRANLLLARMQQDTKEHNEIVERMRLRIKGFESKASDNSLQAEKMSRLSASLTELEGELSLTQRRADEARQEAERLRQNCTSAERTVAEQREIVHNMEQSAKNAASQASRERALHSEEVSRLNATLAALRMNMQRSDGDAEARNRDMLERVDRIEASALAARDALEARHKSATDTLAAKLESVTGRLEAAKAQHEQRVRKLESKITMLLACPRRMSYRRQYRLRVQVRLSDILNV